MEDFGTFGEVGAISDVEGKIVRDIDRFINAVAVLFHVFLIEVHIDRGLVDLRYAVLKPGLDAEFIELDRQHEIREYRLRDFDLEEPDHGTHGGRDDRGRPGHAEPVRDVRLVAQREVVVGKRNVLPRAVGVKCLHAGFEQADAAVVAELRDATREICHALIGVVIQHGRQDFEAGRFVQRDLGAVVAEHECDGLAEIPVRGVANERGARIRFFPDDHGWFSSVYAEQIACIDFFRDIFQVFSPAVCEDDVALLLELLQIADNTAVKERILFHTRFINDKLNSLGFQAFHDSLNG